MLIFIAACSKDKQGVGTTNLGLTSSFNTLPDNPLVGNNVSFTVDEANESNATYSWDFGDKTSSNLKNPSHKYEAVGNLIVKLTVKKGTVEKTGSKELMVSLSNDISGRLSLKQKLTGLNGKLLVCAHRANHLEAPENSLKSVADAIEQGIDMIEIDIRQTKDGVLVLMHDETVNRTTNGKGKVSDFLLKDILKLNLYKANGTLTDQTIPTFKDVLQLARGNVYIDLDIDSKAPFDKVYPVVNQYGMLKQVLFYSSETKVIKEMFNLQNADVLPLPIIRNQGDYDELSSLNINVIQFNVDDDPLKQKLKDKGWYLFRNAYLNSTNTPAKDNYTELNKAVSMGVSIVQTDEPVLLKAKLKSQNLND